MKKHLIAIVIGLVFGTFQFFSHPNWVQSKEKEPKLEFENNKQKTEEQLKLEEHLSDEIKNPFSHSENLSSTAQDLKNFDWNQTTRMNGLDTYAQGEMNQYFQNSLGEKMKEWTGEIKQSWIEEHGLGVRYNAIPPEMNPDYQSYLKNKLTEKLDQNLNSEVESFIKNKIFQGAKINEEIEGEINRLMSEVQDGLRGRLNDAMSQAMNQWTRGMSGNVSLPNLSEDLSE